MVIRGIGSPNLNALPAGATDGWWRSGLDGVLTLIVNEKEYPAEVRVDKPVYVMADIYGGRRTDHDSKCTV